MKSLIPVIIILAVLIAAAHIYRAIHPAHLGSVTATSTPPVNCDPETCPRNLSDSDTAKTFSYLTGLRFSVYLDGKRNPPANLSCAPGGVIGAVSISNSTSTPFYAETMEALKEGTCNLKDNNFLAIIKVVDKGGLAALTKDWATYTNDAYGVSLQYPKDWKLVAGSNSDRYEGSSGFFEASAVGGTVGMDELAAADISEVPRSYGRSPIVEVGDVAGSEARFIIPSSDAPKSLGSQAEMIVKFPKPVRLGGNRYYYFILWADEEHIHDIASTLKFK